MYRKFEAICKTVGFGCIHKKTRCVIKTSCKYLKEAPFVYDNEPIPFETFHKYLGVEISNKCEFNIVKKERTVKAQNAIFAIRQALVTSGNVICICTTSNETF